MWEERTPEERLQVSEGKRRRHAKETNHEANVIGDVLQDALILSLENIIDA